MASARPISAADLLAAWMTLTLMTSLQPVEGHGRLLEPPSRSSMWRLGYPTPKNYDDNALNCGGLNTQWYVNHGKCGVCGDPWDKPAPRDNEAGGLYGKGLITKTYSSGQIINVRVQITANHRGWFEFRLCVHNSPTTPITQECLDRHLLELADGSGSRFPIDPHAQMVELKLKLPAGVSCSQCVLQWKWHGGNNYGNIQEEFYGCSDIAIGSSAVTITASPSITRPTPQPTRPPTPLPTLRPTRPHTVAVQSTQKVTNPSTTTTTTTPGSGQQTAAGACRAVGQFQGVPDLERYCREQCPLGNCPAAYCVCSSLPVPTTTTTTTTTAAPSISSSTTTTPRRVTSTVHVTPSPPTTTTQRPARSTKADTTTSSPGSHLVCRAVGVWRGVPELDVYCNEQCPRGNCPGQCSCSPAGPASTPRPSLPPTTTTTQKAPLSPIPATTSSTPPPLMTKKTTTITTTTPNPGCVAIGSWQGDVIKDQWCNANCPIGICPSLSCRCGVTAAATSPPAPTTTTTTTTTTSVPRTSRLPVGVNPCRAVGPWAGDPLLDAWCKHNCVQYAGCDPQYCRCDASPSGTGTTSPIPGRSASPTATATTTPAPPASCHAINGWSGNPDLDRYCQTECNSGGPCPPEYCSCASVSSSATTEAPTTTTTTTTTKARPTTGGSSSVVTCYAVNSWAGKAELDRYCDMECKAGICPPQYCACGPSTTTIPAITTTTTPSAPVLTGRASGGQSSSGTQSSQCRAVGTGQGVPEMDAWCRAQCAQGNCPPVYCAC